MMRFEDKVKWLSGLLAVLLLTWGLGEFFSPERVASRAETASLLVAKPAEAADIVITGAPAKGVAPAIHLVRNDGTWQLMDGINALPIRSGRVEALLSSLAKAGRRRPVAQAKEAWQSLGLDEAQATTLKISDAKGRVLLDLVSGNRGPTGSDIYVRLAGSDASYLVNADISSWLVADRGSWLDLRIWKKDLASDAVQAVSVNATIDLSAPSPAGGAARGGSALPKPKALARPIAWKFERMADGWKGEQPPPDPVAVESMLRAALNLEGVDIAAQAPAGAFDKIGATITLTLGSGQNRVIEVGAPAGDGRWWVRASEGGQTLPLAYQLSSWALGSIVKDGASFVKKTQ
ncbi:MAG TPA: DUF4340 domain-containing protein [Rectinemataceae bacterium]|nr:DUF4340 domain-containing protein [Rectinemataceae bacterium]